MSVTKKKRKRSRPLGFYKKKLWAIFSQYIRIRDKGRCFTCGNVKPWKYMQAGHFLPKSTCGNFLYFHEQNVHCQCHRCNLLLDGNIAVYSKRIIDTYGISLYKRLFNMKDQYICKYTKNDYIEMMEKYRKKIDDLSEVKEKEEIYSWEKE